MIKPKSLQILQICQISCQQHAHEAHFDVSVIFKLLSQLLNRENLAGFFVFELDGLGFLRNSMVALPSTGQVATDAITSTLRAFPTVAAMAGYFLDEEGQTSAQGSQVQVCSMLCFSFILPDESRFLTGIGNSARLC